VPFCYVDIETRSRVNIKAGIDRYFTQAEMLLAQWAIDDGAVQHHDFMTGHTGRLAALDTLAGDPQVIFVAHNAQFDRAGTERLLGWHLPASRWWCTRAQAYAHGLPGSLEGLGEALGLAPDLAKSKDGARLIQLFCVPHKRKRSDAEAFYTEPWESPADWQRFIDYGRQDIVALREIHKRLPMHNFQGVNREYFWLDLEINERGFAIDVPLIEDVVTLLDHAKGIADQDVSHATGGVVTAVTQRDKLLSYLRGQGVDLPNMTKGELESALQSDDLSPEDRLIIEARLEGARASGAKYKTALKSHVGGRLRHTQQFSGAGRTGRTAHKGFQPGNMPRATTYNPLAKTLADQHVPMKAAFIDSVVLPAIRAHQVLEPWAFPVMGGPNTVAANSLRHMIVAEPGNELTVADYKNIESRITAWYAGEDWRLAAYRAQDDGTGEDQYKLLYCRFFGGDLASINDHQRNSAKVTTLACDFGGSVGAIVTMSVSYGMDLSLLPALILPSATSAQIAKAEKVWWRAFLERKDYDLDPEVFMACHVLVQSYRAANAKVNQFKNDIGHAVKWVTLDRGTLHQVGRLKLWANADVLIVELPSGYRLNYWQPMVEVETVIDPEDGEEEERIFLSFKRARGKKMIRERTWPGLTVENIAQSTANQLLRYGKLEVEKEYPGTLILAVHDEAASEARRGAIDLDRFKAALCKGWEWCRGMPLSADGWQHGRYGKR